MWPSGSCSRAVHLVTNRSWNAGRTVAGEAAVPRRSLARTRARSKHTGRAGEHVSPWEAPRRARNATFLRGRHGAGHCRQPRLPTLICNATSAALDTNEFQVHSVQRHLPVFQHAPMRWTPWGQGASACQNTRGLFFLSFLGSRGRLDASQEPNASGTRKIHSLKYVPACTGWEPASGTAGIVGGGPESACGRCGIRIHCVSVNFTISWYARPCLQLHAFKHARPRTRPGPPTLPR